MVALAVWATVVVGVLLLAAGGWATFTYVKSKTDRQFGAHPSWFKPVQPITFTGGTMLLGMDMVLAKLSHCNNANSLIANDRFVTGGLVLVSVVLTSVWQFIWFCSGDDTCRSASGLYSAMPIALRNASCALFRSQRRMVVAQGGVMTPRWYSLKAPQARLESFWATVVAVIGLAGAPKLSWFQVASGLASLALSIKALTDMALLAQLGDRFLTDYSIAFQVAAKATLQHRWTFSVWQAFVTASLVAWFAGFVLASHMASPIQAAALQVPALIAFMQMNGVATQFLIEFLVAPVAIILPGGDRNHSPFGLVSMARTPRYLLCVQVLPHIFLVVLYSLRGVDCVVFGHPPSPSEAFHFALFALWACSALSFTLGILILWIWMPTYMNGGLAAENQTLRQEVLPKATALREWFLQMRDLDLIPPVNHSSDVSEPLIIAEHR